MCPRGRDQAPHPVRSRKGASLSATLWGARKRPAVCVISPAPPGSASAGPRQSDRHREAETRPGLGGEGKARAIERRSRGQPPARGASPKKEERTDHLSRPDPLPKKREGEWGTTMTWATIDREIEITGQVAHLQPFRGERCRAVRHTVRLHAGRVPSRGRGVPSSASGDAKRRPRNDNDPPV